MRIEHPEYLLLLAFSGAAAYIGARNYFSGRASLIVLTGRSDDDNFFNRYLVKSFFGTLFICFFIAFSVLALADISWGKVPVEEDRVGLDIVFSLDISRSMLAADAEPNRLKASTEIAGELVRRLPSARFGVVIFKGAGITAIPMTEDRSVLESFLEQVDPGMVNASGTDIESGLDAALAAFPAGTGRHRAIVLISDGESRGGGAMKNPIRAAEEGIPVFSIGVGGTEGSTIGLPGGGLVTGTGRKPVVTRLNEGALKNAAETTGGTYFSAAEPGTAGRVAEKILGFEESRGKTGFRLVSSRRYRVFLFAGFLALAMHILIGSLGWKKKE